MVINITQFNINIISPFRAAFCCTIGPVFHGRGIICALIRTTIITISMFRIQGVICTMVMSIMISVTTESRSTLQHSDVKSTELCLNRSLDSSTLCSSLTHTTIISDLYSVKIRLRLTKLHHNDQSYHLVSIYKKDRWIESNQLIGTTQHMLVAFCQWTFVTIITKACLRLPYLLHSFATVVVPSSGGLVVVEDGIATTRLPHAAISTATDKTFLLECN